MYFQQRPDFIRTQVANILAGSGPQVVRIPLQRTFPIEAIQISVIFTQAASIAQAGPDCMQNILRNVNLQIADGVRTRTVVDVSGPALLEYQCQTRGQLPGVTERAIGNVINSTQDLGSALVPLTVGNSGAGYGNTATGQTGTTIPQSYRITYTIDCCPTQLLDPLASMFLLPVTRYPSDPILQLTIAGQNDIDVAAAPTFITSGVNGITIEIFIIRRFVNTAQFAYIDWDLTTQTTVIPAGIQTNLRTELLTPGSYFGTLYRGFLNGAAGSPIVLRGDPTTPGNDEIRIESLGVNFRRFTARMLRDLNDSSRGNFTYPFRGFFMLAALPANTTIRPVDYYFPGSAYNDFLSDRTTDSTELGSVLDANIPVASGAQVNLFMNTGTATALAFGSTGGRLEQVHYRAYGDLSALKGVK